MECAGCESNGGGNRLAQALRGPGQASAGAMRSTLAALGLLVGAIVPALVVLGMTAASATSAAVT